MQVDQMITAEEVRRVLDYDAGTGRLTWRVTLSNRAVAGRTPTALDSHGYMVVRIHGKLYRQHRIAWLHATGRWAPNDIDHINGVRTDNSLANLREATRSQNLRNARVSGANKSGVKGVCWCNTNKRWLATIRVDGKARYLGIFRDKEAAAAAYQAAALQHHGQFARID